MFFHILLVVLSLQLIIIIHELGHLLAAKSLKYPINGLHIGIGRVIYQCTLFNCPVSLKWLPFGGSVEIANLGEHDGWLRYTTVLIGGIVFNILLALVCFFCLHSIGFTALKPYTKERDSLVSQINDQSIQTMGDLQTQLFRAYLNQSPIRITYQNGEQKTVDHPGFAQKPFEDKWYQLLGITPKKPRQTWSIAASKEPKLHKGDIILTINHQPIIDWQDVRLWIQYNPGQILKMQVQRGQSVQLIETRIPTVYWFNTIAVGRLGITPNIEPISPNDTINVQYGFYKAIKASFNLTINTLAIQYLVIKNLVLGTLSIHMLTGPVGIIDALQSGIKQGIQGYLLTLGLLSLAVAVINVLPIPPMDGGQILFRSIECLTRRVIPKAYKRFIIDCMLILLSIGVVLITLNDIQTRLSSWQQEAKQYANTT